MDLIPEQTEDFGRKMMQLSEFAKSIGLKIDTRGTKKDQAPMIETSPEEIKISEVRNLSEDDGLVDDICECYITYLQD